MTRTAPWRRMILHFSHIGLTDGRTFNGSLSDLVPATGLWLPLRLPLPRRGVGARGRNSPLSATSDGSSEARVVRGAQAAAALARCSCHGVSTLGPSAVIATVNSKCAASDPSWL